METSEGSLGMGLPGCGLVSELGEGRVVVMNAYLVA